MIKIYLIPLEALELTTWLPWNPCRKHRAYSDMNWGPLWSAWNGLLDARSNGITPLDAEVWIKLIKRRSL